MFIQSDQKNIFDVLLFLLTNQPYTSVFLIFLNLCPNPSLVLMEELIEYLIEVLIYYTQVTYIYTPTHIYIHIFILHISSKMEGQKNQSVNIYKKVHQSFRKYEIYRLSTLDRVTQRYPIKRIWNTGQLKNHTLKTHFPLSVTLVRTKLTE